jgi:hypothetical protein
MGEVNKSDKEKRGEDNHESKTKTVKLVEEQKR